VQSIFFVLLKNKAILNEFFGNVKFNLFAIYGKWDKDFYELLLRYINTVF
jgi:hypothetical protein